MDTTTQGTAHFLLLRLLVSFLLLFTSYKTEQEGQNLQRSSPHLPRKKQFSQLLQTLDRISLSPFYHMIFHYYFLTFFAWQYSFSITFPSTHGLLDAPEAKETMYLWLKISRLHVTGLYIQYGSRLCAKISLKADILPNTFLKKIVRIYISSDIKTGHWHFQTKNLIFWFLNFVLRVNVRGCKSKWKLKFI